MPCLIACFLAIRRSSEAISVIGVSKRCAIASLLLATGGSDTDSLEVRELDVGDADPARRMLCRILAEPFVRYQHLRT